MVNFIIIAVVGLLESFISTVYSKFRQRGKLLYTAISCIIYNITWFYMLAKIVENIQNWKLIAVYIIFCAAGDVLGLIFDKHIEKIARIKGIKTKRRKNIKRRR